MKSALANPTVSEEFESQLVRKQGESKGQEALQKIEAFW
jgi:hypothetical protein